MSLFSRIIGALPTVGLHELEKLALAVVRAHAEEIARPVANRLEKAGIPLSEGDVLTVLTHTVDHLEQAL